MYVRRRITEKAGLSMFPCPGASTNPRVVASPSERCCMPPCCVRAGQVLSRRMIKGIFRCALRRYRCPKRAVTCTSIQNQQEYHSSINSTTTGCININLLIIVPCTDELDSSTSSSIAAQATHHQAAAVFVLTLFTIYAPGTRV